MRIFIDIDGTIARPDEATIARLCNKEWRLGIDDERLSLCKTLDDFKTLLEVERVDCSSHGNSIASGGKDRTIQVWNALTGKQVARYEGHTSGIQCMTWSANGAKRRGR